VLAALRSETGTDIKAGLRSRYGLLAASGYVRHLAEFPTVIRILDTELRLITPTDPEGVGVGREDPLEHGRGERERDGRCFRLPATSALSDRFRSLSAINRYDWFDSGCPFCHPSKLTERVSPDHREKNSRHEDQPRQYARRHERGIGLELAKSANRLGKKDTDIRIHRLLMLSRIVSLGRFEGPPENHRVDEGKDPSPYQSPQCAKDKASESRLASPVSATRICGILYAGLTSISFPHLALLWLRNSYTTSDDAEGGRLCWNAMHHALLQPIEVVRDGLRRHPCVGTTKLVWPAGRVPPYPTRLMHGRWVFAGTLFWFRHDQVFTRPDRQDVPQDRYGTEA